MKTKNSTHLYKIVDRYCGIVFAEFLSTEFDYKYSAGYWAYLQRRKALICKGLGLNPFCFYIV